MATFHFNLQAVLQQRKRSQEQWQRELANLDATLARLKSELAELEQSLSDETADTCQGQLLGQIDLAWLSAHRRFLTALRCKMTSLTEEIAAVSVKWDAARARMATAAAQYQAIEKLRERQLSHWQQEVTRKEMLDMDDIATRLGQERLVAAAEQ